jgi:hypothetical protein
MPRYFPSIDIGAPAADGGGDGDGGTDSTSLGGSAPLGAKPAAVPDASSLRRQVWYQLTDDHSVLELPTARTSGLTLALHVVVDADADATIAWWEVESGVLVTQVGAA